MNIPGRTIAHVVHQINQNTPRHIYKTADIFVDGKTVGDMLPVLYEMAQCGYISIIETSCPCGFQLAVKEHPTLQIYLSRFPPEYFL